MHFDGLLTAKHSSPPPTLTCTPNCLAPLFRGHNTAKVTIKAKRVSSLCVTSSDTSKLFNFGEEAHNEIAVSTLKVVITLLFFSVRLQ